MPRYTARWANEDEKRVFHEENGVVEDVFSRPAKRLCFVSPMAAATRVAAALNLVENFSDRELIAMTAALAAAQEG